jgi:hypothetical protein
MLGDKELIEGWRAGDTRVGAFSIIESFVEQRRLVLHTSSILFF